MVNRLGWLHRQAERLLQGVSGFTNEPLPVAPSSATVAPQGGASPLESVPAFANPGGLELHSYVPHQLPAGAPLVVVLHGCGQQAEDFATQSGWRYLAARHHFALLMPGQTEANNAQTCFNWFRPGDIKRGHGEVQSIVEMVAAVLRQTRGDPKRVFVTGLSAGGAMTAALLAAYPDVFAGGAVVAGLPAGAAGNVIAAMSRMAGRGSAHDPMEWAGLARRLGPPLYLGSYPRISIWHGLIDPVVAVSNGRDVAAQFAALHGLAQSVTKPVGAGMRHTLWGGTAAPQVELWELDLAGHVYPTALEHGISAAHEIAKFWGIAG